MEYKALYRQWRPQSFEDVVGQEHITKTLVNAINTQRIAHAYLFCGPRGTGKTSTAKIIGKTVNCNNKLGAEPCNKCEACQRIDKGLSMDVQEIDAASNRGIEEIRDLREKVKYAPSEGKYKVYIVDEVHMLTTEAFNALLKTLEEPPEHVIFIMATTEPHKIPATILSRCQRFDFRRISNNRIVERLEQVATHLNIDLDEEAVKMLAKAANGGLRDALSTLDQCIAYTEGKVTIKEVTEVIGTVTSDVVIAIAGAILDQNANKLLNILNELMDDGKDPQLLLQDLLEHFRNLLLTQICQEPGDFIVLPQDTMFQIKEQAERYKRGQLDYIIEILSKTQSNIRWSNNPQLMVELGLLKVLNYEDNLTLEILAERISKLENGVRIQPTIKEDKYKAEVKENSGSNRPPDNSVTLEQIKDNWNKVIKGVKKLNISTYAFLVEAQVCNLQGGILTLGYTSDYNFHRERISQKEHLTLVEQVIKTAFGAEIKVKCTPLEKETKIKEENILEKAKQIFGEDKIEEK